MWFSVFSASIHVGNSFLSWILSQVNANVVELLLMTIFAVSCHDIYSFPCTACPYIRPMGRVTVPFS